MPVCGNYLFFELPKKIVLNPKDGSDNPFTGEATTAEERQQNFTKMMEIALTIA